MLQARLNKLQTALKAGGIKVAVALPGANLRYLTNIHFHPSERPLLLFFPAEGQPVAVIPVLEHAKLSAAMPYDIECFPWDDATGPAAAFRSALAALGMAEDAVLGVEPLGMRFQEIRMIEEAAPGITFTSAAAAFAAVRRCKDAEALALLRKAIAISQAALAKTLKAVKPGMTERSIGKMLELEIIIAGGDVSFILVQGGEGAAQPHGDMSDRVVKAGDCLLIDYGAAVGGYSADITRTFVMGGVAPTPDLHKIYTLVQAANAAGRAACGPGVASQDVDRAARKVIVDGGYGEYFFHRTGHGLGLEVHEEPYINEGNTTPLAVGDVFTVEPGIYVPGLGGVRIEDDLVITEDGAESLTTYSREWTTVGQ